MKKCIYVIICLLGLYSCEEYGSISDVIVTEEPISGPVKKTLSTDLTTLSFEAEGGTSSFAITSNTSWSITKPEWCSLSESSGTGNATISVTANENPNTEQRSGQIVISGDGANSVTITITQKEKVANVSNPPGEDDNTPPS